MVCCLKAASSQSSWGCCLQAAPPDEQDSKPNRVMRPYHGLGARSARRGLDWGSHLSSLRTQMRHVWSPVSYHLGALLLLSPVWKHLLNPRFRASRRPHWPWPTRMARRSVLTGLTHAFSSLPGHSQGLALSSQSREPHRCEGNAPPCVRPQGAMVTPLCGYGHPLGIQRPLTWCLKTKGKSPVSLTQGLNPYLLEDAAWVTWILSTSEQSPGDAKTMC